MNFQTGVVIEVFIPEIIQDDYGIKQEKIGFKVDVDGRIIEITQNVNDQNLCIFKDDKVLIIKSIINDKEFIDIAKYGGDTDE